jgi:hypothetical protein
MSSTMHGQTLIKFLKKHKCTPEAERKMFKDVPHVA